MRGPASRASLRLWNTYVHKGLPLTCPCRYKSETLEVVQVFPGDIYLLKPEGRSALTLVIGDDLMTTKPETI